MGRVLFLLFSSHSFISLSDPAETATPLMWRAKDSKNEGEHLAKKELLWSVKCDSGKPFLFCTSLIMCNNFHAISADAREIETYGRKWNSWKDIFDEDCKIWEYKWKSFIHKNRADTVWTFYVYPCFTRPINIFHTNITYSGWTLNKLRVKIFEQTA